MSIDYHDTPMKETGRTGKPFELVKAVVPVWDVAGRYTDLDSQGRGCCPVHGGANPESFKVYEDSFHCFSCGASGSAADLEYECGDYSDPIWAAIQLIHDFGLEDRLGPSEAWKLKQARQKPVRDKIGRDVAAVLRRRIFKWCYMPLIEATAVTPEDHDELTGEAWEAFSQFSDAAIIEHYRKMKERSHSE